jgi:putative ABC transport system permease protein
VSIGRWLGWLLPKEEREFVLGDLEEAYAGRTLRATIELIRAAFQLRRPHRGTTHHTGPTHRRGDSLMRTLLADLRYGLRQLTRSPSFTFLSILTLALGIGATTAIFSVVNPILFRALPYPDPDRIVRVAERDKEGQDAGTGYATFVDVQRMASSFEAIAVASQWQPTLQGSGDPERLDGQRVTQGFFSVLGVRPSLGRDFTAEENVRGKHRVAILSHGLWQRRFGGDPTVIGRQITFDGIAYTIVGVMPKRFESLLAPTAQVWAPLGYEVSLPWACRTCHHLGEYARLKPGISPAAARRELDVISARLVAEYPTEYAAAGMLVVPLNTVITRDARPALLAALGAVGFVLLIACANVSGLLLGRAMQREEEFAVRAALGAGRQRMVRQLLTESVLLSLLGGAVGVTLAWWGVKGLTALAPASLPRLDRIGIDGGVLGFTALLSLATGLLFGLIPALASARPDLFAALRPGGRHTGHRSRRLARGILVAGEIALALMLLVGAGLLLKSLDRLLAVNPGFDPKGLLTMEVQTTGARYKEDAPVWSFFDRALEAVKAVPGVEAAGWTSQLPLGGNFDRYGVQIEGKLLDHPEQAPSADRYAVSPDYLRAMRIPLRRGRALGREDAAAAPPVVLINETFARVGWAGEDPIGKRVQVGGADRPWRTVVGIVGDVHHTGLDEQQAPQMYLPEIQWIFADGAMVLAARTRGDPAALAPAVRAAIRSVDPSLPILHTATMDEVLAGTAQSRRFAFVMFQVFALVALLLAAAGIYGVLAGSVTERTREIGIRSALGASRGGLLRLVVGQGLVLTLAGLTVGTAGALLLSRFLGRMLFGVGPRDPVTFAAVVVVLLTVAMAACWGPAWRATRVSPLEALRGE